MEKSNRKMRTKLYIVMIIFALPMLASWLLYQYHGYFRFKTSNHGQLIQPLIQANYFAKDNDKKWRILYVSQINCDEQCKKIDYDLHQIQIALGKDQKRVVILRCDDSQKIIKQLQDDLAKQESGVVVQNKIYLIDPLNNVFMYYLDTVNPMNILKDIKKVLEVSQIG